MLPNKYDRYQNYATGYISMVAASMLLKALACRSFAHIGELRGGRASIGAAIFEPAMGRSDQAGDCEGGRRYGLVEKCRPVFERRRVTAYRRATVKWRV
ncbi:MAG: hypothetical protein BGP09_03830 [Rhizobium sp. 60-20]|nr:MAG: hypothetical protein BGP09_03830 [Rhizobium sp. 60-20]